MITVVNSMKNHTNNKFDVWSKWWSSN